MHQACELAKLWQVHRHHGLSGGQVLIDLDRVGGHRQRNDLERQDADIEAVQVVWQLGVSHLTGHRHIGHAIKFRSGAVGVAPYQHHQVIRVGQGNRLHQAGVEPFGDGAVVADHPAALCVPEDPARRIAKEPELAAVADQRSGARLVTHCVLQPLRSHHHQVRVPYQQRFGDNDVGTIVGETAVVVHAIVHNPGRGNRAHQRTPEGMLHQ